MEPFVCLEPTGFYGGDANLTRFVGNDATNNSDPTGEFSVPIHAALARDAINSLLKQRTIGQAGATDLKNGLARGVTQPDLQFSPTTGESAPADAAVGAAQAIDRVKKPIDQMQEAVKSRVAGACDSSARFASSLGGFYETGMYDKLIALRNWWQDSDFVPSAVEMVDEGLEAAGSDARLSDTALFQTHYGSKQWQHAMANGNMTAEEMQEALVNYAAAMIEEFRKNRAAGKNGPAGFSLGLAMHMLQDSYSRSHVVRDKNGCITQFQSYPAQSPTLHGTADDIEVGGEEYNAVQAKSESFIEMALDEELSGDELKQGLRDKFFSLSENADAGGTARGFSARNGRE